MITTERSYNIRIPGFTSEEISFRQSQLSHGLNPNNNNNNPSSTSTSSGGVGGVGGNNAMNGLLMAQGTGGRKGIVLPPGAAQRLAAAREGGKKR